MDGLKGIQERLDRMDRRFDEMEQRFDQVIRVVEQVVHMVAENNGAIADLRSQVEENGRAISDLRTEISAVEERLTSRLNALEEQFKVSTAIWQAESRHFAHSIGELRRDVAVLKQR